MRKLVASLLAVAASGCPDVNVDDNEGVVGPTVEFDPGASVIPFPNNLLLDPTTGRVNLPAQCGETPASQLTREGILNQLDGFGTYQVGMRVTFTEPVDAASLTGKIVLYKRATVNGATVTPVDPATATAIPVTTRIGTTTRFTPDCATSSQVDAVTIIPLAPLEQKAIYTVGLLAGITSTTGGAFGPSFTWALVRQAENPVTLADPACNPATGTCEIAAERTPLDPGNPVDEDASGVGDDLETLNGIDLLWKAHAGALSFLEAKGHVRGDVVLGWEFKTQTTVDAMDPAVTGTPAAAVSTTTPLLGTTSLSGATAVVNRAGPYAQCGGESNALCYLRITLGAGNYAAGTAACNAVGCAAIGNVLGAVLLAKQFQVDMPNTTYSGTGARPVPGMWSDPVRPTVVHDTTNPNPLANDPQALVEVLVLLPVSAPPASGYPTVVFQHGLGRQKTDVLAVAGRLAADGFAVVAIDAVNHGSRAVRISSSATGPDGVDCSDVTGPGARYDNGPSPTAKPSCYADVFSTNLGVTRDNFRQSIIDQQQLVASLAACGTTACGALEVDPTKIVYLGQSLGGIFGAMTTGLAPQLKAAVLNVAGAGWVDILENTETLAFQCPVVDGLIDAGLLTGQKYDPMMGTGLCTTDTWKTDPAYLTFAATGRWILDAGDPANFNTRLAAERILIQEVVGDTVVPNIATGRLGALVGLTAATADPATPALSQTPTASAAISTNAMSSKYVRYPTLPSTDNTTGGFGNLYSHGSLLSPAAAPGRCLTANTTTCTQNSDCSGTPVCVFPGALGTLRMQIDAVSFLTSNR